MARTWAGEVWVRRIVPSAAGRGPPRRAGLGDVEGVPQVAGRVVGRDVQELEVELLGLHLGALEDLEAVGVEHLAHVAHERVDRVQVADRASGAPARSCRAPPPPAAPRASLPAKRRQPLLDGGLDLGAHSLASCPSAGRSSAGTRSELRSSR